MKNLGFFLAILFFSCANDTKKTLNVKELNNPKDSIPSFIKDTPKIKGIDTSKLDLLTDIQSINNDIRVDLKYATTDNFIKLKCYERLNHAYLQKDVAMRLGKCQEYLTYIDPSLHLLVYDAVRPLSVQKKMWEALDSIPIKERVKFVANPAGNSLHNYGAAVDLTICDNDDNPLDMGAGFDDMRQISFPSLETTFLSKGLLTKEHIANRTLLRKIMHSQGFTGISTEWWHFNACSRAIAATKYKLLVEEP